MARRKKPGATEGAVDLLSLLPWWVCITLAAASYLVLRRFAAPLQSAELVSLNNGKFADAMQGLIVNSAIHGFATVGQYVVPIICFVAAILSILRRKQRRNLITDVSQAKSADALEGMSWREFELLVGEAFRLLDYRVTEIGGGGPDGGVDLVLTKGGEKFFVQCKQWKAYMVGVAVVRELYGVMAAKGATGGFVVTSGRFSADAKDFAQGRNIQLIDGPRLFAMIQRARQAQGQIQTKTAPAEPPLAATPHSGPPACPSCGAAMKLRTTRRGGNAGGAFWGCVTYPNCRGKRATE